VRLHVVVPEGFDDPARPSGGNRYDQRVCAGLVAAGWDVRIAPVGGSPGAALAAVPDGEVVLLDGLVASPAAAAVVPHARRLRLVVLVHMPVTAAARSEREVLGAAARVVTTSDWTRRDLLTRYGLRPEAVDVARPGVDPAPVAPGTPGGGALLCVAPIAAHKGQDVLVSALAEVADLDWQCICAGAREREPGFAAGVADQATALGIGERLRFAGVLTGAALDDAYAGADLLVVPSRAETYGIVVTEALARAIPVVAAAVGGVREAFGRAADGALPGALVSPDDPDALAGALRAWLTDSATRDCWRAAARQRRTTLDGWDTTVRLLAAALTRAGEPRGEP
jgi:glycosyltransferase involved in cell wall biosynthesis